MKILNIVMPAIVAGIFASCSEVKKHDMSKTVSDFATLECEAVKLREQRFELANNIRFTEDTLMHPVDKNDTARLSKKLAELKSGKETLLNQSRAMAERIKQQMDSLMHNELKTSEDRKQFNRQLDEELKKRGCV